VKYRGGKNRFLVPILVFALALSFHLSCGRGGDPSNGLSKNPQNKPEVDFPAPGFSLEIVGGRNIVNLSDYKGKVVLLNFWASWCFPCREEMPSMQELYQIFKDREFEILAVNLDKFGEEKVLSFVSNYGLTFPILLDKELKTAQIYEVRNIPTTYIIDKNGIIKEKIIGEKHWTEPELVNKIETLMSS
jgi:peroxiredoxin